MADGFHQNRQPGAPTLRRVSAADPLQMQRPSIIRTTEYCMCAQPCAHRLGGLACAEPTPSFARQARCAIEDGSGAPADGAR